MSYLNINPAQRWADCPPLVCLFCSNQPTRDRMRPIQTGEGNSALLSLLIQILMSFRTPSQTHTKQCFTKYLNTHGPNWHIKVTITVTYTVLTDVYNYLFKLYMYVCVYVLFRKAELKTLLRIVALELVLSNVVKNI